MLPDATRFYIDGQWVTPVSKKKTVVIDPSTELTVGDIALANETDVNRAVAAARQAFDTYSKTSVEDRLRWLEAINQKLIERNDEIAAVISSEMGAPKALSQKAQATSGSQHFSEIIKVLSSFRFQEELGNTLVKREPIGVCVLISPWNWPLNQVATKVAPALAAGCTMVLKPSEMAPFDAVLLAEIIDGAGVPAGVFNLVHGMGSDIGDALTSHPDVDMISFTGSTRAGVAISRSAATGIKRVSLELGGKSAGLLLDDADIEEVIPAIVGSSMSNSGQSCNALTRLVVPVKLHDDIASRVAKAVSGLTVGAPESGARLGPLANENQFEKVNALIQSGIDEGANLLVGGTGRPEGLSKGYFVRPTVFSGVTRDMTIAREEIFGPVLCIMPASDEDEAINIANDSEYGLSGYVWSKSRQRAVDVAGEMRTGMVHINGAPLDSAAPFGGFKMSGNGREWGEYGLEEFLEYKSVYGAA